MNIRQRRRALLLATAGLLGWWVVAAAPAASASCDVGPPEPSVHAFVGRVIATESADRVATVATTDGKTVQVVGTPVHITGDINSITTVDRRYVVGATYEFHPGNDSEPYEDNNCTATHRLHGEDIPASLRESGTGAEVQLQPSSGNNLAAVGVIAGVAVAGAGGAGLWLWRRRAS